VGDMMIGLVMMMMMMMMLWVGPLVLCTHS